MKMGPIFGNRGTDSVRSSDHLLTKFSLFMTTSDDFNFQRGLDHPTGSTKNRENNKASRAIDSAELGNYQSNFELKKSLTYF